MGNIQKEDKKGVEDIVQKAYDRGFQNILDRGCDYNRICEIKKIEDIHINTDKKAQANETAKEVVMRLLGGREFPAVDKIYSVLQDKQVFDKEDANRIYDMFFNQFLRKLSPDEFSRDYNNTLGSWGTGRVGYEIEMETGYEGKYKSLSLNLRLSNKYFEKEHIIQFKEDDELRDLEKRGVSLDRTMPDPDWDYEERKAFCEKKYDDLRRLVSCEIGKVATKKAYAKTKELAKDDLSKLQEYLGHMPENGKVQQYFKEQLLEGNTGAIPIAEEILEIKADYNNLQSDVYDQFVDNVEDRETRNLLKKIMAFTEIPAKFNEDKIQGIYKNNLARFRETTYRAGLFGDSQRGIHYGGGYIIEEVRDITKIHPKFSNNEVKNVQELLFDEKNIDLLENGNGIIKTIKQMKDFGLKEIDENIAKIAYHCLLVNNPEKIYELEKVIRAKPIFDKAETDEAILNQLEMMPQINSASNKYHRPLDGILEIAKITKRDIDLENQENISFRKPISQILIQTYKRDLHQERERIEGVFSITENDRYTLIQEGLVYDLVYGSKYDGSYITPDINGVKHVLQKEGIKPEKATLTKFANKCFNVEPFYQGHKYIEEVKRLKDMMKFPIDVDEEIAKGYVEYQLEKGNFDAIKDLDYVTGKKTQFK